MTKSPQTLKELVSTFVAPLTEIEMGVKKPFIDAGFPDIPTPAEFGIRLVEALPELPAIPGLPGLPAFPALIPKKVPPAVEERVIPGLVVRYG